MNIYPLMGPHQALPAVKFKHRGFCQRSAIHPDYQSQHSTLFCQALLLSNRFCHKGITARSRPQHPDSSQAGTESKALSCPWTLLPEAQDKKPSQVKRKHLLLAMCSRLFSHHFQSSITTVTAFSAASAAFSGAAFHLPVVLLILSFPSPSSFYLYPLPFVLLSNNVCSSELLPVAGLTVPEKGIACWPWY